MNLVTLEYLEVDNQPNLALFLRNGRQREMKIIKDFRPYFYIKAIDIDHEPSYYSIDNEVVQKYYTKLPQDVLTEVKNFPKVWEDHVKFTTRYLVDEVETLDKVELRTQYTDIETDITSGQIMSISAYDNYLDKCVVFVWREDLNISKYDRMYSFPSGYTFKASIRSHNSRRAMLQDYIIFIKNTDPDILTGWYSTSYDFPQIIKQIHACGLDEKELSPLRKAYCIGDNVNKLESNIKISGRILFDMLKAYRSLQPTRLRDGSLEAISQIELKEGKHAHRAFKDIWKNIDELVEYNAKDCVLVYRIDQKKKLLTYFDTLRRFSHAEWGSLYHETSVWDAYILHKLHNKLVLPTKKKTPADRFKGAKVVQPFAKGIHRNILLIDLKGLYPSIIITFNMSPETLIESGDNCCKLPNGAAFKKDKVGLLPEILLEMLELRNQYKAEMDKHSFGTPEYEAWYMQQEAIKVMMNALYGAMKYENFRLVTPKIAESVAYVGRNILEFVIKTVESMGYKILYGDTDSVFIYAQSDDTAICVEQMKSICAKINSEVPAFVKEFGNSDNCTIHIDPKKVYKAFMMSEKKSGDKGVAKKCYAGLIGWAKGEYIDLSSEKALEVMGYSSKRSDSSELSRDVQRKVIRMLLEGCTNQNLKLYIDQMYKSLMNSELNFEYVGIPKGLSQSLEKYKTDNPHRRASIYSNKYLGTSYGVGDKPRIIYVSSTGKYPKTDCIAFNHNEDIPKDFKMDVNLMIEKCIIQKIEHILNTANLSLDEILYQTSKMEDYF